MHDLSLRLYLRFTWTTQRLRQRIEPSDQQGEITATTAIIVLLTVAALTAGGIIAGKIVANANRVPSP